MLENILFLLTEHNIPYSFNIMNKTEGWDTNHIILKIDALKVLIWINQNKTRISYYLAHIGQKKYSYPKETIIEMIKQKILIEGE